MGGPLHNLRRLAASASGLLLTRAQFASLELAEARTRFARWLALALAICVLAALGLAALAAALVLALWPLAGWLTLLPLALLFGGSAAWLAGRLRRQILEAPPLLAQTLEELGRDRDSLLPPEGNGPAAAAPARP